MFFTGFAAVGHRFVLLVIPVSMALIFILILIPLKEKYLKKIRTSITLTEWRDIVKKAIEDARRGDYKARQWLSDYLIGKPKQAVDITTGGEKLTKDDPERIDRAISTFADAIGKILSRQSSEKQSTVDAAEHTAVASDSDKSG